MLRFLAAYLATLTVFLGLDYIYLTRVARRLYSEHLGDMLLEKPRLGAAAVFYALYVAGVVVLVVLPALKSSHAATAVLQGALVGLLAYATYDMTNYATLRNWPLSVALIDIAWGAVLTGVSAGAGYAVVRAAMM